MILMAHQQPSTTTAIEPPEALVQLVPLRAWLVLGAMGCVLALLLLWAFWGELRTTVTYIGVATVNRSRETILYLPFEAAESARTGMSAQIVPMTGESQVDTCHGQLTEVGQLPASPSDMRAVLGDETLVESILASGPLIKAHVLCDQKPADETGVLMSRVTITTRVEQPISRLFPAESAG
jgi:hypothetical protein